MADFNETAIDHLGGSGYAGVSTGERALLTRLDRLLEKYPDDVERVAVNQDGAYYRVPWKWIRIAPPRKVNLTDERKALLADRMRSLNDAKTDLSQNIRLTL